MEGEMTSEEGTEQGVPAERSPFRKPTLVRTIPEAPVVFADGIINQVTGPGIAKFHFYREDAVVGNVDVYEKVEVLQVIMPANSFIDMVAFFEHRIRVMVKNGYVSQSHLDERRAFYSNYPV
jgi:hypothetical protein